MEGVKMTLLLPLFLNFLLLNNTVPGIFHIFRPLEQEILQVAVTK